MRIILLITLALLTGCSGVAVSEPPVARPLPAAIDDTCGAARYGGIIGKDAFVLQRGFRPGEIRIITPGTVAAQDYNPERLSFVIGLDNTIRQINCG